MRDRYASWNDRNALTMKPIMAPRVRNLEDLVLQDLAKAQTESEKIEILDSYSLASQRRYRNDLYGVVTDVAQKLFVKLLGPTIEVNLPQPQPPYHPSVGMATDPTKLKTIQ